ncbi:hypothetical protein BC351_11065 [Paenibacillus ferrarius]|uniref:Uncharacterized protein n=1 Tax=Paenibacillus ferrarius TaxID=1469647 RepID=A0A1V4H9R0_9BACL|nr:hypothetical protein BC351_11065 [Paenibacillus ferrarius]
MWTLILRGNLLFSQIEAPIIPPQFFGHELSRFIEAELHERKKERKEERKKDAHHNAGISSKVLLN